MTDLLDLLAGATLAAQAAKERVVANHTGDGPDETDMFPTILAHRGGVLIAAFTPLAVDRDAMLNVAHLVASATDADVLTVAFETFNANRPDNPLTGRHWGPNEMQDVWENHAGYEQGWVDEAIMVHTGDRHHHVAAQVMPYRVTDGAVAWGSNPQTITSDDSEVKASGMVWNSLAEIMRRPTMTQMLAADGINMDQLAGEDFDLTPEEARIHGDIAVGKSLHGDLPRVGGLPRTGVTLFAEVGSLRAEIIEDSFPGHLEIL